ncbi:MAG: hypothetical protein ACNI28_09200 [Arcobacter sp.]|uniref:hypothetical protein n=1 Tax=Arcobacter sp. TaxID=1872629 RepID=UPI003B009C75
MNNRILPSLDEFKYQAKELKKSENYERLGHAQNALAQKYGFISYQAILPNLKAIVENNNDLVKGLELPSFAGIKSPKLGSQFASFISFCFGHKPTPNKNNKQFEYTIDLTKITKNEDAQNFFYTLVLKTSEINTMLQVSFFAEIYNDYGNLYLKTPFEITYPFGKKRELLKGVFDEDVITLILSIKAKNK